MDNMQQIATKNFKAWNNALQIDVPEDLHKSDLTDDQKEQLRMAIKAAAVKMAALYDCEDEEFMFFPTLSRDLVVDGEGVIDYFEHHFMPKFPDCQVIEEKIRSVVADKYTHFAILRVEVGPINDRKVVEVRGSYRWRKHDGAWKIISHHSSIRPTGE